MSALATAQLAATFLPSASDSVRVVAQAYSVSLAVLVPAAAALVAAVLARRATAGTQALIWRGATVALAIVLVGQLLPFARSTAIVPQFLAAPLIVIGQLQLAVTSLADGSALGVHDGRLAGMMRTLTLLLACGVIVSALRAAAASIRLARLVRRSSPLADGAWGCSLREARARLALTRPVRLAVADVEVPMVCGTVRPTILLPAYAVRLAEPQRRALLLHELAHVHAGDLVYLSIARALRIVLWFHPAAHWVGHRLHAACERAADDRVLALGVRASDYASLLLEAEGARSDGLRRPIPALALDGVGGLRGRLSAVLETRREIDAPSRRRATIALSMSVALALPTAATRPAPPRAMLTALLEAPRWESRAYAVIGLAQRADSVDVARAATERDPNPRVRAWGRAALAGAPIDSTRVPSPRFSLPNAERAR